MELIISDLTYFARRSCEEWAAAMAATDPASQAAHVDLALRYELIAKEERANPPDPWSKAFPGYVRSWRQW